MSDGNVVPLYTRADLDSAQQAIRIARQMMLAAGHETVIDGVDRSTLAMAFAMAVKSINDGLPGFRQLVIASIAAVEAEEAALKRHQ